MSRLIFLFTGIFCSVLFQLSKLEAQEVVIIGNQAWMIQNLNVDRFSNGDLIFHASSDDEWRRAAENKQPAWCYYDNDPDKNNLFGKLYNWYAVNDSRGLAPKGYHVPTGDELLKLNQFLGDDAGVKLKSAEGWGNNGSNSSGFRGLPGGERSVEGEFKSMGQNGNWWSSSEYFTASLGAGTYFGISQALSSPPNFKGRGLSVRCLKD